VILGQRNVVADGGGIIQLLCKPQSEQFSCCTGTEWTAGGNELFEERLHIGFCI